MKNILFFLAVILTSKSVYSQNLIPNSSFEVYDTCGDAHINHCVKWHNPTASNENMYYYQCDWNHVSPPVTDYGGYQPARTGTAIIALMIVSTVDDSVLYPGQYNRSYAQVKLDTFLIPNHHYRFSVYTSCIITDVVSSLTIASNNICALLTSYPISDNTPFGALVRTPRLKPQVKFTQVITDTLNWTLLTQDFIADSSYRYMTMGNFYSTHQTQITPILDTSIAPPADAYYAFDDVSLIDLDAVGVEEVKNVKLEIYPNPCGELLVIELLGYLGNANTIQIYDVLGREITVPSASSGNGRGSVAELVEATKRVELNVSKLTSGVYFLKLTDEKGNVRMGKFVKE